MRIKPSYPRLRRDHPLASGLVGVWSFSGGSGNTSNDAINGTPLILTGAWSNGEWGARSDATAVDATVPPVTTFSVFCLAAHTSPAHFFNLPWFLLSDGTANNQVGLRPQSANAPSAFWFASGARNDLTASVTGAYVTAVSGLHGVTYNGANASIYANGKLSISAARNQPAGLAFISIPANIGMSALYVWNRALSPQEVWQLNADPFAVVRPKTRTTVFLASAPPESVYEWSGWQYAGLVYVAGDDEPVVGELTATLEGVIATSAATLKIAAGVTATLEGVTASATASQSIVGSGSLAATLEGVTATASAVSTISAVVTASLEGVTAASLAVSPIVGGMTATLDGVSVTAAATQSITGSGSLSVALDGVTVSAAALSTITANVTASLDGVMSVASASSLIAAGVTILLDGVTVSAVATDGTEPAEPATYIFRTSAGYFLIGT